MGDTIFTEHFYVGHIYYKLCETCHSISFKFVTQSRLRVDRPNTTHNSRDRVKSDLESLLEQSLKVTSTNTVHVAFYTLSE